MKSSPSSSSSSSSTYDVFLSFRGTDTRKTFTGHLYSALKHAGFHTFIDDDELPRGENISDEHVGAIRGSRMSVIVFSKNYGGSQWCLEELVEIMKCRGTFGLKVSPIFYDVEPTEVRGQKGGFSEAFKKHEEQFASEPSKLLRWREALREAADLSGWDLTNTTHLTEAKLINLIVEDVSRNLNKPNLFVARYMVGIDSRLQSVGTMLKINIVGSDDTVRVIGILGLSGIGKTTIAKALYNEFSERFEGSSFLADVGANWTQVQCQVRLQEQLLSDVLKRKTNVPNTARGKTLIKERLCRKRVLVIIDNVDDIEQINALLGSRDWFGLGSRIVITTKDKHLLKIVEVADNDIYRASELSSDESLELFSWHAFRRSFPSEEYRDLSNRVVEYCGGLPLALEVLGSLLLGRSKQEWESLLDKLRSIPDPKIQQKLEISFNTLIADRTVKDIFLHISCFFIGEERDHVQQILDGCDLYAAAGINQLVERCFITVDAINKLMVHNLLRDMAREIVRKESPKDPGKCSRLWFQKDIFAVLRKDKGTENIEGLCLKLERDNKISFDTKAFQKMENLRLLQLNNVNLKGSYEYMSKELRWLCWEGFPLKYMPDNFDLENLVTMELKHSNLIQLYWKHAKLLEKLTFLDLSHSHCLTHTPDFSSLPNLKKLILKYCKKLQEIHQSIGNLGSLVSINLKDCEILTILPKSFYNLESLETLILSGCLKIDHLDEDLGEMVSLTTLHVDHTRIKLPSTIVKLKKLKELVLHGSKESSSKCTIFSPIWSWLMPRKSATSSMNLFPPSFQGLNSLKKLSLCSCNLRDDNIPKHFESLPSLETFDLRGNCFRRLPSLGSLSHLKELMLDFCEELEVVPELPAHLPVLSAYYCLSLKQLLPRELNLLSLDCCELVDIRLLLKDQYNFIFLNMSGCYSLRTSFKDISLEELMANGAIKDIVLPGDTIPNWFPYISGESNSIRFQLPDRLLINQNTLKWFILCLSFSANSFCFFDRLIMVLNRTKRKLSWGRACPRTSHEAVETGPQVLYYTPVNVMDIEIAGGDQIEVFVCPIFPSKERYNKIGVYIPWPNDASTVGPRWVPDEEEKHRLYYDPSFSAKLLILALDRGYDVADMLYGGKMSLLKTLIDWINLPKPTRPCRTKQPSK